MFQNKLYVFAALLNVVKNTIIISKIEQIKVQNKATRTKLLENKKLLSCYTSTFNSGCWLLDLQPS